MAFPPPLNTMAYLTGSEYMSPIQGHLSPPVYIYLTGLARTGDSQSHRNTALAGLMMMVGAPVRHPSAASWESLHQTRTLMNDLASPDSVSTLAADPSQMVCNHSTTAAHEFGLRVEAYFFWCRRPRISGDPRFNS